MPGSENKMVGERVVSEAAEISDTGSSLSSDAHVASACLNF